MEEPRVPAGQFEVDISGQVIGRLHHQNARFGLPSLDHLQALGRVVGWEVPQDPRLIIVQGDQPLSTKDRFAVDSVAGADLDQLPPPRYVPTLRDERDVVVRLGNERITSESLTRAVALALYMRRLGERNLQLKRVGIPLIVAGIVALSYGGYAQNEPISCVGYGMLTAGAVALGVRYRPPVVLGRRRTEQVSLAEPPIPVTSTSTT